MSKLFCGAIGKLVVLSVFFASGSCAFAATGCAPGTKCLSVQATGVSGPGPNPYTAQCSGFFPDFLWPSASMPLDYHGPWFILSQSYPSKVPTNDAPWLKIDFKNGSKGADDYLYALRDYSLEGMIAADFRPEANKIRPWFHMPMMTFGPHRREPAHGLTSERSVTGPELGLKPGVTIHNYAVGFYNAAGAVTIGKVWKGDVPDLKAAHFAPGTMAFKILFSDAKAQDFQNDDLLAGAPQWTIFTKAGLQVVRLMQMDVAAVDPRSPTGWVFGTFAYQKTATDQSPWRRLRPVGLSWGNDPGFTPSDRVSGKVLTQTIISDQVPDYAGAHLGWAGRTNGPVDNPKSGCLSCHGTAQFPVAAPIIPPNSCKTDAQKLYWFRNFVGSEPFGVVDPNTCKPMKTTASLAALDFSLQMQVAAQSALQFKNVNPCHPATAKALPFVPAAFMDAPRVHR